MRMRALLLGATIAVASVTQLAAPASASLYCADLGPVPGWGPVCTVRCVLGTDPSAINPKDIRGTLPNAIPVCPA